MGVSNLCVFCFWRQARLWRPAWWLEWKWLRATQRPRPGLVMTGADAGPRRVGVAGRLGGAGPRECRQPDAGDASRKVGAGRGVER